MPRKIGKFGRDNVRKRHFHGNRHTVESETDAYDNIEINLGHSYVILDFLTVFNFLSSILKCKTYDADIKFSQTSKLGLGFTLTIKCDCPVRHVASSPKVKKQAYEINRRLTMVMRLLGQGFHGDNLFCGFMDLSIGVSITL